MAEIGVGEISVLSRLTKLRRYLDHLYELRPRVTGAEALQHDLSFQNDVLFSLQVVCQQVIGIAAELSTRRGLRFRDYVEAIRNLASYEELTTPLIQNLEGLPELRDTLIFNYVARDFERIIEALDRLGPIEEFVEAVRGLEADAYSGGGGMRASS